MASLSKNKTNLRQLDWADLIVYFTCLVDGDLTAKDLVDYFHFKYLSCTNVGRWTMPDYLRQKSSANKLLSLYGKEMSIKMIDTLFEKYEDILKRKFGEINWSIGMLSSDTKGWLAEKIFAEIKNKESRDEKDIMRRLLMKPEREWTVDDRLLFKTLTQGDKKNG